MAPSRSGSSYFRSCLVCCIRLVISCCIFLWSVRQVRSNLIVVVQNSDQQLLYPSCRECWSDLALVATSNNNNGTQDRVVPDLVAKPMSVTIQQVHQQQQQEEQPPLRLHAVHVGFSKCGTSSFLNWFMNHPELVSSSREVHILQNGYEDAMTLLETIWQGHTTNLDSSQQGPTQVRKIVTKDPSSIYRETDMTLLSTHFPSTKVIVGIRHPVLWFLSFYNFRVVDRPKGPLPPSQQLIGSCIHDNHVCTDHARFHVYLEKAFYNSTSPPPHREDETMENQAYKYMEGTSHKESLEDGKSVPGNGTISNGLFVFLYETEQLGDSHETRNKRFRQDLTHFLQLNETFPKPPLVKPEQRLGRRRYRERQIYLITNFCAAEYQPIRAILMQHAKDVADWIQDVFLQRPNVFVSSPEYIKELLDQYRRDPLECDKNISGATGIPID